MTADEFDFDLYLNPTREKISRANLDYYHHVSRGNLSRWISEIETACGVPDPEQANERLERWMDENLNSQQVIVDYYKSTVSYLAEIESVTLKLKQRHYPRIRTLLGPTNRQQELVEFLHDLHDESARLAGKYLAPN
jgi:hypothetical protein